MVEVELALATALKTEGSVHSAGCVSFALPSRPNANHRTNSAPFDGTPPPHFYGELVKTDEGCDILRDSGHFDDFAAIISLHAESDFDQEFIETLKSVLWAVVRCCLFVIRCDVLICSHDRATSARPLPA
jgi:hypothetical protein